MEIEYINHSCFKIRSNAGNSIVIDPHKPEECYLPFSVSADGVLISHNHDDHNNLEIISGGAQIITGGGEQSLRDFSIKGYLGDHGSIDGRWLGFVNIYKIEADGITCLHLSDIGILPDETAIKNFGKIDILFTPVGGYYTLDAEQSWSLAERIAPRVVIPMHYAYARTNRKKFPIGDVNSFIKGRSPLKFVREKIGVEAQNLPDNQGNMEIWVMTPSYL